MGRPEAAAGPNGAGGADDACEAGSSRAWKMEGSIAGLAGAKADENAVVAGAWAGDSGFRLLPPSTDGPWNLADAHLALKASAT